MRSDATQRSPGGMVVGVSAWLTAPSPPVAAGKICAVVVACVVHTLLSAADMNTGEASLTVYGDDEDMSRCPTRRDAARVESSQSTMLPPFSESAPRSTLKPSPSKSPALTV